MQVIVLATEEQKAQLVERTSGVTWINDARVFATCLSADAFVDLTFEPTEERIATLAQLLPKPVIINSVAQRLGDTHPDFIRINGWTPFLSSPFLEATCRVEQTKQNAEAVFTLLGKKAAWLPDSPGFVTARVVSMIINEAYLALEEGVSTEEEINTAMKLGTAYPFGPFEWAGKIGVQNVVTLLQTLGREFPRYTPAGLLVQAMGKAI